jgi:hypothetical protein
MRYRTLGLLLGLALVGVAVVGTASAASSKSSSSIPVIQDSQLQALYTTVGGGAPVLPTQKTVQHWWGSSLNPSDGVTYGYNMVGADPNGCSGSNCDATITADIIPVNVVVGGMSFDGTDVVNATLASPQFATNDYGSTTAATNAGFARGAGGALSQLDAGNPLQLQDARTTSASILWSTIRSRSSSRVTRARCS